MGKDTPSAIEYFEKGIDRDPKLPWNYLALTEVYSSAAFRNEAKVVHNLRAYHKACPASLDAFAYLNVIQDAHALRELAGDLRVQLQNFTDSQHLRYYPMLWAAEFRVASPAELERSRTAVAGDLRRIEPFS